jgi:hypothetical protein
MLLLAKAGIDKKSGGNIKRKQKRARCLSLKQRWMLENVIPKSVIEEYV